MSAMDSVENMHDFNIPSIDHEAMGAIEVSGGNEDTSSSEDENDASPAVQATDSEALSSLLMLSKSNADNGTVKNFPSDSAEQDAAKALAAAGSRPAAKKPAAISDRAMRTESSQPLSKSVKMEDLRKYFHLPIVEVARQLGTCTTALKKICRKNKISKWPYRQIRSITKSIQSLEMASLNDTLSEELRIQYRQQIVTLQNAIDELIKDPNSVVELVNMGLSEEALQNLRESNAAAFATSAMKQFGHHDDTSSGAGSVAGGLGVSSEIPGMTHGLGGSAAGPKIGSSVGYMVPASSNGGAAGVINLLHWPKPSADVQQIMQAAAQLSTSSDALGSSSAARKTPSKALKRKAGDSSGAEDGTGTSDATDGQASGLPAGAVYAADGTTDVSQLEGGNLRHKKVEIGETLADCSFNADSQRMVFAAPVHLAPLQRKKLRPNITRKVVPLMEPDIGSNFAIEFIPQFVLAILHTAMGASGATTAANSATATQQHAQPGTAQGHPLEQTLQAQHPPSGSQQHSAGAVTAPSSSSASSSSGYQSQAQPQGQHNHGGLHQGRIANSYGPHDGSSNGGNSSVAGGAPHYAAQQSVGAAATHVTATAGSSYVDLQQAAGMVPTGPLHQQGQHHQQHHHHQQQQSSPQGHHAHVSYAQHPHPHHSAADLQLATQYAMSGAGLGSGHATHSHAGHS